VLERVSTTDLDLQVRNAALQQVNELKRK